MTDCRARAIPPGPWFPAEQARNRPGTVPTCSDFDADCELVPDKVHCYLYDPAKGRCPYLSAK